MGRLLRQGLKKSWDRSPRILKPRQHHAFTPFTFQILAVTSLVWPLTCLAFGLPPLPRPNPATYTGFIFLLFFLNAYGTWYS